MDKKSQAEIDSYARMQRRVAEQTAADMERRRQAAEQERSFYEAKANEPEAAPATPGPSTADADLPSAGAPTKHKRNNATRAYQNAGRHPVGPRTRRS